VRLQGAAQYGESAESAYSEFENGFWGASPELQFDLSGASEGDILKIRIQSLVGGSIIYDEVDVDVAIGELVIQGPSSMAYDGTAHVSTALHFEEEPIEPVGETLTFTATLDGVILRLRVPGGEYADSLTLDFQDLPGGFSGWDGNLEFELTEEDNEKTIMLSVASDQAVGASCEIIVSDNNYTPVIFARGISSYLVHEGEWLVSYDNKGITVHTYIIEGSGEPYVPATNTNVVVRYSAKCDGDSVLLKLSGGEYAEYVDVEATLTSASTVAYRASTSGYAIEGDCDMVSKTLYADISKSHGGKEIELTAEIVSGSSAENPMDSMSVTVKSVITVDIVVSTGDAYYDGMYGTTDSVTVNAGGFRASIEHEGHIYVLYESTPKYVLKMFEVLDQYWIGESSGVIYDKLKDVDRYYDGQSYSLNARLEKNSSCGETFRIIRYLYGVTRGVNDSIFGMSASMIVAIRRDGVIVDTVEWGDMQHGSGHISGSFHVNYLTGEITLL
jgi:hypothetical protein